MCGIAGWVDFDRDLTTERATALAMTETMSCRGPDDQGLHLDRHAALGNRRLAVIDVEGGHMPMEAEGLAVITYSGEVYNFGELRAELAAKGHRFRTRGDTEVVLRGYLEWGEGLADRINGMYAFAIWDEREQELLLIRDRMGIKPLFYYPLPNGVLFGSEPKAILANPLAPPVVGLDGLRRLLSLGSLRQRSIYKGLFELPPGHLLRVSRHGTRLRRYWALEGREHTDDLDMTVGTVRELLDDIVGRQLVSDVPICTLLSGGLDSSIVTALARTHGPIRSFAVDYAGYAENFQADETRGDPDRPFVRMLADHVGSEHTDIVLGPEELADPKLRAAVVRAWDAPGFVGDLNTSLYMLFRAIREHSTVALSGESADEVFGGYAWFHLPEMVNAGTFPWLAMVMREQQPTDILDKSLVRRLDLDDFTADGYRTALAEVPHVDGQDARERRMREICHLHLTRFLPYLLDRKDRMSMAVGLEVRVPFCDHRLVEYVFNTPWSMKTFDGREKSLLRAAGADLLPEPIVRRVKAPYPVTQDVGYEKALRAALREVAADRNAPVLPLLDPEAVRAATSGSSDKMTTTMTRYGLELALDLNVWLTSYGVRLEV
ncbi:asparagine synthase (glutamine-hydrolyzing) [Nonomuraea sp. WAC 01424]|uniref:asparagine synthase (glutamine-hydrolyzing) n=1 Tax=Nonomuraea sp. WAC 01424 TaxID=2203200 RepID=UPI000F771A95|nr:asparagine synthase (glutamine-hydrolyzing) [Nonomuraea sp. WAC 01424]RSM98646.1 asparagine synthase (glutamine-hydrolyzing) [Nonomuraea sp. WAC 01424]